MNRSLWILILYLFFIALVIPVAAVSVNANQWKTSNTLFVSSTGKKILVSSFSVNEGRNPHIWLSSPLIVIDGYSTPSSFASAPIPSSDYNFWKNPVIANYCDSLMKMSTNGGSAVCF
jgi:hypothetical protein